ncbi:MAG: hypothetical protein OXM61_22970 [Candidatus Poribacteria bacterium]|nr:hypothetical protein [Candidatus Poribacteria bacterium]
MSTKKKLTTVFEISIENHELLINYEEIVNEIPSTFKNEYEEVVEKGFPIKICLDDLISRCDSNQEIRDYIYEEVDVRVLSMVNNLLSAASAKMVSEYEKNSESKTI